MSLRIHIAAGSETPIYRQIVHQVRRRIAAGMFAQGDPLPSVRGLAEQLVINPNTVAKAYAELVHDGLVESRQGRGYFVADRRPVFSKAERTRRLEQALDSFLNEALVLDFPPEAIQEALARRLSKVVAGAAPPTETDHD